MATRKRDRFFALMGAMLFLVSASALTVAVVYDAVTNKQDNTAQTTQDTSTACDITQVTSPITKLPDGYQKDNADVDSLVTEDIRVGDGQTVKDGDCIQVKYYGTLAKDGTLFDENYTKTQALQLQLGQGQVIPGWETGLKGMKIGGERRLVIPPELAYGENGQGSIPANATLVFLVKLVAIK